VGNDITKSHGTFAIHLGEMVLQQAWPEPVKSFQALSNGKKLQADDIERILSLFAVKDRLSSTQTLQPG
jgi:hypothetical protein